MGERKEVFISYSHRDEKWLQRLRVHLRPLEREHRVEIWDDKRIIPGSRWREQIRDAIELTRIAVLLVSADFLASDFIATDELPSLLKAAEQDGVSVLTVIVSPSRFLKSGLSQFQTVNEHERPLIKLNRSEQETVFVRLTEIIEGLLKTSPEPDAGSLKPLPPPDGDGAKPDYDPDGTLAQERKPPQTTPARKRKVRRGPVSTTEDVQTRASEMTFCIFCNGSISDEDVSCPHCTAIQPGAYKRKQPPAGHARLVVTGTSDPDAIFTVEKKGALIGRGGRSGDAGPDIDLTKFDCEKRVSRLHAKISWKDGEFVIEDLGSTNGTSINEIFPLTPHQPRILKFGDRIRLGGTTLYFLY